MIKHIRNLLILLILATLMTACGDNGTPAEVTAVPPTASPFPQPTQPVTSNRDENFIVVATDAPNAPYSLFDEFGLVDGFDSRILANIAAEANLDYELVVTPFEGVLENISNNGSRDFDAVIANLVIPEEPPPGIVYTVPYLEVGQVLVILADNDAITSHEDLQPGMLVGAAQNSHGAALARTLPQIGATDLVAHYENGIQALQALIDESVTAVIIDNTIAEFYAQSFPEQLKIVGGNGRTAWISSNAYGIAVAADSPDLLRRLNEAIEQTKRAGAIDREVTTWLIPKDTLEPGESRVGTPTDELFIGVIGSMDMDPATQSSLLSWELLNNTMSGLYRFTADNQLESLLAAAPPVISEDGLEYTIALRSGLRFPDGSELTASDVQWSLFRARSLGNFTVNSVLKDSDDNFYFDDDAVQIIDPLTVRFVLQEPTSHFPALLATPPFFPISNECYPETADPLSTCGGIGPYTILDYLPGERIRLRANPEWPGRPSPAFANIMLRFYEDPASMRRSLQEFGSIDLAWRGLAFTDFVALQTEDLNGDAQPDFQPWSGPADFKSYARFNQEVEPWTSAKVRQAFNLALDRRALADLFGGSRLPLTSPVPNEVPGYVSVFPTRDLARARALLLEEGYSATQPLPIELYYVSDGRYSNNEEAYANTIKAQLEETGVFQVTAVGVPFDQFITQVRDCNYPAYMMGWPTPGRPVDYLDVLAWTEFLATSNAFCANYDSPRMTELITDTLAATDPTVRLELTGQIQQRWAEEYPTLDILQEITYALSLNNIANVSIDAMGLLHYELLTKGGG
jgi:peptide/nickel transport system substrate-binding protein